MSQLLNIFPNKFDSFVLRSVKPGYDHDATRLKTFIKTKVIESSPNHFIIRSTAKNSTRKNHKLASIVVADVFLPSIKAKSILENGWLNTSNSVYKKPGIKSVPNNLFLHRDTNHRSFQKKYGYIKNSIVSEWYTKIEFEDNRCIVIGAVTTKDQFSQVFVKQLPEGLHIRVTCQLDSLILKSGESINSENIAFVLGTKSNVLKNFSKLIAKFNNIPKIPNKFTGLNCAYYDRGNHVDEKYIRNQLKVIESSKLTLDYLQIDAGYFNLWGDWLDTTKHFPNGLKKVCDQIINLGIKPGIWIAPFVASPESKVFKNNPSWFLKDSKGNFIEGRGCSPFDGIKFLSFRVLDITNTEVIEHIQKTVKEFVNMGFSMIKVDFTYPIHLKNTYYHDKFTRAQIVHNAYSCIRKAVGDDVILMSAITHISPVVGIVNMARVGSDSTAPVFYNKGWFSKLINKKMLTKNLLQCRNRSHFNNILWKNDADCIIYKSKTGIDSRDVKEHQNFILQNDYARWLGDDLSRLKREGKLDLAKRFITK